MKMKMLPWMPAIFAALSALADMNPDFVVEASGAEKRLVCSFPKSPAQPIVAKGFRFGEIVCDIEVTEDRVKVVSNRAFSLMSEDYAFNVKPGANEFIRCSRRSPRGVPKTAVESYAHPQKTIELLPGEYWWGGEMRSGKLQPFSAASEDSLSDLRYDHSRSRGGNGAAPLLLSSKGRYVWCERPIWYRFGNGMLYVGAAKAIANTALGCRNDSDEIVVGTAGTTLREAYLHCSKTYFPPRGTPNLEWFRNPIINTWASLTYFQNEKDCLEIARGFKELGMTPGVFMVDHGWHEFSIGSWDFHRGRFPDPKRFVKTMKEELGYKAVVLWFDDHITTDSLEYRELRRRKVLLRGTEGFHFESSWWAGCSAVVDCMNPAGYAWMKEQQQRLMKEYGVDGFFLDAGDPGNFFDAYAADSDYLQPVYWDHDAVPADYTWAYHHLGTGLPFQQHRAMWKHGGYPIKMTEMDKPATFEALRECLADGLVAGLLGYPFLDFDMVGGGWVAGYKDSRVIVNQEQFVRSMQLQCLSPMVQFSIPPWKALDGEYLAALKKALAIRQQWAPYITETAVASGKTGEPMMRTLEYAFPGNGYEKVMDEFMMGDRLLVAPQMVEHAVTRRVMIPPGTWTGDDGKGVTGPCEIETATPIDRLPRWERMK